MLDDFEGLSLLSLGPEGVIPGQGEMVPLAHLFGQAERVIVRSSNLQEPRPIAQGLGHLPNGGALGDQNVAGYHGDGSIRSDGGGHVSGGGDTDCLSAPLLTLGELYDGPASLEHAGRVGPLIFDVEPRISGGLFQFPAAVQGGSPFVQ